MIKPYINKPCKPSLRVKPIQPYIADKSLSISRHSEKWREEFQKNDRNSPFTVGRTHSPIVLGPHTTLERFEHEILKKDNVFKIPLNSPQNIISKLQMEQQQRPDLITKYVNGVRQLINKDSEDLQPIKEPFSNQKSLINQIIGNSLPEMPKLVPIEKPINNQTSASYNSESKFKKKYIFFENQHCTMSQNVEKKSILVGQWTVCV